MSATINLKAIGLNVQPNQLDPSSVPPGSLIEASNAIIKRDNVIESRRGYKLYGEALGTSTSRADQLAVYKAAILRHFDSSLQWDTNTLDINGDNVFNTFNGSYIPVKPGLRMRFIEANSNFYFTTIDGVQKISATNSSQFITTPGYITQSGGVKALDFTAALDVSTGSQTGWFQQDAAVAYRILWNTIDINDNLVQGTPSQRVVIYNPLINLILRDQNNLLLILDNIANNTSFPSLINIATFIENFGLPANATAPEIQAALIALATELDTQLVYANQTNTAPLQIAGSSIYGTVGTVAFTNNGVDPANYLSSGQVVNFEGFTPTTGTLNGPETVSTVFEQYVTTGNESAGTVQISTVQIGADYAQSLAGRYFTFSSPQNTEYPTVNYYAWYQVGGAGNDPAVPGATGIMVTDATNDDAATVAAATQSAITTAAGTYFTVTVTPQNVEIATISVGSPTTVTTADPHGLANGDSVTITGSNSTPSIDGTWTATVTGPYTFTVPVAVTIGGNAGSFPVDNLLTLTNNQVGPATDTAAGTTPFLVDTTQQGTSNNMLTNVVNTDPIVIGSLISGANIPADTFVTAVGAGGPGTVTISNALGFNTVGTTFTFAPGFTFDTAATGPVGLVNATINSYTFENITQPGVPNNPPSDQQLVDLQTYLQAILTALQSLPTTGPTPVISPQSNAFIAALTLTTSANVLLTITIPKNVTTNDFFQIYRSPQAVATGPAVLETDVVPSDELQQVYEAYPTQTDINNGYIVVEDIDSDAFLGAYLYTNATTGVGILEANELPPVCMDMNYFKNVMFYANTRRRYKLALNLLGVSNIITDYNEGNNPSITISNGTITNTYYFVTGLTENSQVTTTAASTFASSGPSSYFTIYSANNATSYYVWYQVGTSVDPMPLGINQGIEVVLTGGETAAEVAQSTVNALVAYNYDFTTTYTPATNTFAITTTDVGYTNSIGSGTMPVGFIVTETQAGRGANPSLNQVLLSTNISPALAVDQTAQSLVHVINLNDNESVYAYYISSPTSVPGQMSIEERNVSLTPFYIIASDANVGTSFSPDLSPDELITNVSVGSSTIITTNFPHDLNNQDKVIISPTNSTPSISGIYTISLVTSTISAISAANPTQITTTGNHGLANGDIITISGTNSTPLANGTYTVTVTGPTTFTIPLDVTVAGTTGTFTSPTQFSIPVAVTVAGTTGAVRNAVGAPIADNEVLINRIYYSQYLTPEGVPLVNTIDVGSKDKAILRIFPLRDSLFVFKEDGLFRISGETAPFTLQLFDSSVVLVPPDSVDVSNNLIFAWTTKGIHTVSEAGVNIISRPIDTLILPLATPQYTNFGTATWGIGYESDNSYTVYTVSAITDTVATIAYRYSTLTNSWTTYDKTDTCGVINSTDDLQYLGAGDTNYIEQERKTFTRYDYADRETDIELTLDNYFGTKMVFFDAPPLVVDSVLVQNQYVTLYDYNTLLQKLDADPRLTHTYEANLTILAGVDIRTAVDALLAQIANDPIRLAQLDADPASTYLAFQSILGTETITNITASNPAIVTTSAPHGLQDGRIINIAGTNTTPVADGQYAVTVLSPTTFSIPFAVTGPGTTGTLSVNNEDFQDVQASWNAMAYTLNNDPGIAYKNYPMITNVTVQESIILQVNPINNVTQSIIVNFALNYLIGPLIVFASIPVSITWAPQTLGDALGLKHMREMTMMFENKAFTSAIMNFATDLLPSYNPVTIIGDGNGIFGFTGYGTQMPNNTGGGIGFGGNFFGGGSNSAPFRTYIPRNNQRCRYLVLQFQHNVAREQFAIFGISLIGEISQSTRAYR
jgi:hypothetical protein